MTVATTTNKAISTGNGEATVFPFTFSTLPSGDLVVTLFDTNGTEIPQTETTHYTVQGKGEEDGGSVTFLTPPPNNYTVLIQRLLPFTQPTDYKNQGSFYPRTHERSFDRATMQVQQLGEADGRTVKIPAQVQGVSTELPTPVPNALWGWDAEADAPRYFTPAEIGTTLAFSNFIADTFTADPGQTEFILSDDPGAIANLDVSIDGVTQVPGVDYTLAGTTLTFAVAMAGGENVLARYGTALPTGITDAGAILYTPPITGVEGTMKSYLDALQDDDEGDGSALIRHYDPVSATYLKTISDMLNGMPVSVMRFINPAQHSGIRNASGSYDAAADLNAAFAAYKNLVLPAGRYLVGSTLLLPDRLTLRGDGWSVPFSGGSPQSPQGSVFRLLPNADCDVFRQAAKASRYALHLSGFAIDGDGANQGNVGNTPDGTYGMYQFNRNAFFFEALYNAVFEDLFVYNMRGAGWALHGDGGVGMTNVFMQNCHSYNCRTYSVYTEGSVTDLRINGGDFGFGRVANLRLTSSCTVNGAVFWTSQCQDPTDAATHATGTGAVVNGGVIVAGNNNKIVGCRSEGNSGHGIRVVGNDNKVSDCVLYFNSSTAATAGLFDGVNDLGDRNVFEDLLIRQSTSSPHALRKAITLEAGANETSIYGGQMRRVGANAASVATPVAGLSWADGDRSDFSWASGEVKAYSAAANNIGTGATKVQFRTETVDARSEWDIVNDQFVAAETGIYRIDTGVNIANVTDGNSFIIAIYKNGAEYRRLGQQRAGAGSPIQIVGGLEMKLESGDIIDVRGICGTATNTNVGAALTWIEITQING